MSRPAAVVAEALGGADRMRRRLIMRAGLPAWTVHASMSLVTTDIAPTTAPSPTVTPGPTNAPAQIQD